MLAFDQRDALGDVLGIVTDPFDHRGDLERGDHLAKVIGHGRAQGNDADDQSLDLGLDVIDLLVVVADILGEIEVAALQRAHGVLDRFLCEATHLTDEATKPSDVLVKYLDGMFRHVLSPQPYRPVI